MRRGRNCPKATTTPRSGACARSSRSTSGSPTRSGRSSATPARSASAETGEGPACRPRPRGRSGWLTTAATGCRPARSLSSVGTAKSGVPKKASRSGALSPASARRPTRSADAQRGEAERSSSGRGVGLRVGLDLLLAKLLHALAHVHAALEPADAVDEEDAVEVVDLVLEAHRLEPLGLDLERVAVEIGRAQAHALGALDVGLEVRNREAAFVPADLALGLDDLGVHEDARVLLGALLGPADVDHHQA